MLFRHLLRRHGATLAACGVAALAAGGASCVHASADGVKEEPLCIDKLACHRDVAPPRTPAVLVSGGSFNPPTVMHLRMFDLATKALAEQGYDVWGCYMSPVADAYGKQGLAPVHHRVAMCRLAAEGTDNVMVDTWEAAQPGYTRTLQVLRHVSSALQDYMQPAAQQQQQQQPPAAATGTTSSTGSGGGSMHAHALAAAAAAAANLSATADHAGARPHAAAASSSTAADTSSSSSTAAGQAVPAPRVMLLCGADLLATINQPGVWKDPDIILQQHGIVCVVREGTDIDALLQQPGSVLHKYRHNVIIAQEPVANGISSTVVRRLLASGQPVNYLLPDAVLAYVKEHGLYSSSNSK